MTKHNKPKTKSERECPNLQNSNLASTYYQISHFIFPFMRMFMMRLTFESVEWVKQTALPNMDGPHLIYWRTDENKQQNRREFAFCLAVVRLGHWYFPFLWLRLKLELTPLALLVLSPEIQSGAILYHRLSWVTSLPTTNPGTFQSP